jgi:hypothetical protein
MNTELLNLLFISITIGLIFSPIIYIIDYLSGTRINKKRTLNHIFNGVLFGIFLFTIIFLFFQSSTQTSISELTKKVSSNMGAIITFLTAMAALLTAFFTRGSIKELENSRIQAIETKVFPKISNSSLFIDNNKFSMNFYYYEMLYNLEIWLMDSKGNRIDGNINKIFGRLNPKTKFNKGLKTEEEYIASCADIPSRRVMQKKEFYPPYLQKLELTGLNDKINHIIYGKEGVINQLDEKKPNEFEILFNKNNLKEWPNFILIKFLSEYHNEFIEIYELRKNSNYHAVLVYRKHPWNKYPWHVKNYLFEINESNITVTESNKIRNIFNSLKKRINWKSKSNIN